MASVLMPTDSRIRTYVYNENDIYLITMETGFQSIIEFETEEKIQTISLGENYAWSITPNEQRLIMKPLETNIRTNMTVITNLRTYYFDLVSKSTTHDNSDIAYVIRFFYPKRVKNER